MNDYTTITLGKNLDSYPLDKFRAASLRIDNPSACWYYVVNNRQVIPPYTYNTVIQLDSNTSTLTINFLSTFAGQASKIVGNPVQVYITSAQLSPQTPISIASSIPYVNTFLGAISTVMAPANGFQGLFSIFPTVPMRLRLSSFRLKIGSIGNEPTTQDVLLDLVSTTADGVGALVGSASQDADSSIVSQCNFRGPLTIANTPGLSNAYRSYRWPIPNHVENAIGKAFEFLGPDLPPSTYSTAATKRGIMIEFNDPTAAVGSYSPFTAHVVWTEEPLS